MVFLVVDHKQRARHSHIATIIEPLAESEVLFFDDTMGSVVDLEQYLYPSLFVSAAPIIHVKFVLGEDAIATPLLKQLIASPTVFVFEEMQVPTSIVTAFKKAGAVVHSAEKKSAAKKEGDIFAITKALTAPDKKSRWLAYRAALIDNSIEGVIGILYWKAKELVASNKKYHALYRALIQAHARAWEQGTPLELEIEKVILTQ